MAAYSTTWLRHEDTTEHVYELPLPFSQKLDGWLQREQIRTDYVRLVLVGKTGVGKSATGNTILGRKEFVSKTSSASATMKCEKKTVKLGKRMIQVIDTPGLFDTAFSNEEIKLEIAKCITMSSPGPHVFLLMLSVGRFTNEEMETVQMIQETFGENSKAYTMVGFTRGEDILDDEISLEEYIKTSAPSLQKLIRECGGRTQLFCNKNKATRAQQVQSLLKKIDIMIQQNGGSFYTTAMYNKTETSIRAREKKMLERKLQELSNMNRDREVAFLANELSKVKLALEETYMRIRDVTLQTEETKKMEELRADLEKKQDKKTNEIGEKIFQELERCHSIIRRQAEEAEAISQSSQSQKKSCIIS